MARIIPGTAISIYSDGGYVIGLVTHVFKRLEDVVWISQDTFKTPPTLRDASETTSWRWPTTLTVNALLRHSAVELLGRMEVPVALVPLPLFRGGDSDSGWREAIIEPSGDLQPGPITRDRNLPPLETPNLVALIDRIVSDWTPADRW